LAILETGLVKNADVGFVEPSGLQGPHRGVRVSGRIVDSNKNLVSDVLLPVCVDDMLLADAPSAFSVKPWTV
jgi:hypothetical protein